MNHFGDLQIRRVQVNPWHGTLTIKKNIYICFPRACFICNPLFAQQTALNLNSIQLTGTICTQLKHSTCWRNACYTLANIRPINIGIMEMIQELQGYGRSASRSRDPPTWSFRPRFPSHSSVEGQSLGPHDPTWHLTSNSAHPLPMAGFSHVYWGTKCSYWCPYATQTNIYCCECHSCWISLSFTKPPQNGTSFTHTKVLGMCLMLYSFYVNIFVQLWIHYFGSCS